MAAYTSISAVKDQKKKSKKRGSNKAGAGGKGE